MFQMIRPQDNKENFSILIPFHHRHDLLFPLLKELHQFSILVVDDGPFPTPFPSSVNYIRTPNIGFSRAVNTGLEELQKKGFDRVLILNDDATISPTDVVKLCQISTLHTIVSPIIRCNKKTIYGVTVRSWGRLTANFQRRTPIDAVYGTCMLIPSHLRFDERFPHGFEDIELCLRVTQDGYKIIVVDDAICFHQGEGSISRNDEQGQRASAYGHLLLFSSFRKTPIIAGLCLAQIIKENGGVERYVGLGKGIMDWCVRDAVYVTVRKFVTKIHRNKA